MPVVKSELQADLRKLRKSLRRRSKRLTPEDVHRLRTRARRFLSLTDSDSLPSLAKANLKKALKRIRKRASRVRDMDVLTSHLAALHSDSDPSCRTQLFEYLGAKRYRRADRLTRLLEDAGPALRKELRDALRMAGGTADSRFAGGLGQCNDAIGEWHDWEELIAIAEKILGHGPHCPLLRELKEINRLKLHTALTTAERLRTDYARPGLGKARPAKRKSGKAPRPLPIPERALKAVARALA